MIENIKIKELLELLDSYNKLNNPTTTFQKILNLLSEAFELNSCLIVNEEYNILAKSKNADETYSKSKIKEVISSKNISSRLYDIEVLPQVDISKSIRDNYIVSIIILPMKDSFGKLLGAIYMDRRVNRKKFTKNEFELAIKIIQKFIPIWYKKIEEEIIKKTGIIFHSKLLGEIINKIKLIAKSNAPVFIIGETGVGKELFANLIYYLSPRWNQVKKTINCSAIPNDLIEDELFGHEEGAFTGATKLRIGAFEYSNNGTLFLDEIGDMNINTQAKILRAIENKEITRIGGNENIKIDVRIIAATNRKIENMLEEESFRNDLYQRLQTFILEIPPLRQRREDIVPIAEYYLLLYLDKYEKIKPEPLFTKKAINKLKNYHWPGNIRELKATIERTVIMYEKFDPICEDDIEIYKKEKSYTKKLFIKGTFNGDNLDEIQEQVKAKIIQEILKNNNGNISLTANELGVTRPTVYYYRNISISN